MFSLAIKFGETTSSGGISSLGLNLKGFVFQLITFVILLVILTRWVFPRLVATLEKRRQTLEQSLIQAKQTEEALHSAEAKAAGLLKQARQQADGALADAKKQAEQLIAKAEQAAEVRTDRIAKEAESQLQHQKLKLHDELRDELADLVVATTEKVLREKLDREKDIKLIQNRIRGLK